MTNDVNPNDPVKQRAIHVEEEMFTLYGKEASAAAVRGLSKKMADGYLSQSQLLDQMSKSNAASQLFYDGIAAAPESEWREWRNRGKNRAEMLARIERDNRKP